MATESAAWREVGNRVAARRVSLGMDTQRQLAESAGVHKNTISKLELGGLRRPGKKWGDIEGALQWPRGKLVAMYRDIVGNPNRVPADVLERAVRDTLDEAAPHLTVRQARRIAEGIAQRLEQDGYLLER